MVEDYVHIKNTRDKILELLQADTVIAELLGRSLEEDVTFFHDDIVVIVTKAYPAISCVLLNWPRKNEPSGQKSMDLNWRIRAYTPILPASEASDMNLKLGSRVGYVLDLDKNKYTDCWYESRVTKVDFENSEEYKSEDKIERRSEILFTTKQFVDRD